MRIPLRLVSLLSLTAVCLIGKVANVAASPSQESLFQDDYLLVFRPPTEVARTLDRLRYLGVDRIRVTVFWNLIAPDPGSRRRPRFNAADPSAYPSESWTRYDKLVRLAAARGIGVNFNVWGAVPSWAATRSFYPIFDGHFRPSPTEFGRFIEAIGRRYSGTYLGDDERPLPRISFWSIWNEPNGIHFLAPGWQRRRGQWVEEAAVIYRALLDSAWRALSKTGHDRSRDTILFGETAPEAKAQPAASRSLRPLRFLRALYCVDESLRPLRSLDARLRGCPTNHQTGTFPAAHPALFQSSAYAHHAYQLLRPPTAHAQRDEVTTADLPSLTATLDRIYRIYRQRRRLSIYNTEFGYESRPPSVVGLPLGLQAVYLNESEFLTYQNPRIASYAQFLLTDSRSSNQFQTGLQLSNGRLKPAFGAYRTAIWVPRTRSRRRLFRVWGLFRPARANGIRSAFIQFARFSHPFHSVVETRTRSGRGYVDRTLSLPAPGWVRLAWRDPATNRPTYSRSVAVFR